MHPIFPIKLIYPKQRPDQLGQRKELTARNQAELERLLRLGWQIKDEPPTFSSEVQ